MQIIKRLFSKKETRQNFQGFRELSSMLTSHGQAISYHFSCIRYFQDLITTLPVYVSNSPDHYLNAVFKSPSFEFDTAYFYSKLVSNFFQYGEAKAIINFNESGQVESFTLDWNNEVFPESNGFFRYRGQILLPSQVVHIKDMQGSDKYSSISRRQHLTDLQSRADYLSDLMSTLLKTNFQTSYTYTDPDESVSGDKEKSFKDAMTDIINGVIKQRFIPVPKGSELKPLNDSKNSSLAISFSDDVRAEIAAMYGLPKQLLNISQNLAYNILTEAFLLFLKSSFNPLLQRMSWAFSSKLFTREEINNNVRLSFDTSRIQHIDSIKLLDSLSQSVGVKPYLFPTEAREYLNLPPSDELDDLLFTAGGSNAQASK